MSDNRYDAIVIGAGVGGLTCANYLAREGKKILVLEHGKTVGGNIQGIRRKGFFFDAGSQSTENVGILFPILEELGLLNTDDWDRADFRWITPDCDVPLKDFPQVRSDFKRYFPDSSEEIDRWFDFIEPGCELMNGIMSSGPFPLLLHGKDKYKLMMKMGKIAMPMMNVGPEAIRKGGAEKGREIFHDPRLAFLFGEFGNENMLLFMHFSFWYSFFYDYIYPKGGLMTIARLLADNLERQGIEIQTGATVNKILLKGRTAIGVETADGECHYADKVVNTGNPQRLVTEMLDVSVLPQWYYAMMKNSPVSISVITAFLGLDVPDAELEKMMKTTHNLYWRTYEWAEDPYDAGAHRKGWEMITWVSRHDKSLAPENQNSIIVQIPVPYDWMNGWGTGSPDPEARNDAYKALKKKVLKDVIADTEYILPGISKRIAYKELATPRTLAGYTLNPQGSIMGWSYDRYRTPLFGRFGRFTTPVENLYMAGHYSIWPGGIVFSMLSGKIVSEAMYRGVAKTLLG